MNNEKNIIIHNTIYLTFERKNILFNRIENRDRNVVNISNLMIIIFVRDSQSVFRPAEVSSCQTVKSENDSFSVIPPDMGLSLTSDCEAGRIF